MFHGIGAMHDRCGACGYIYARESGYWLGAMYVNYGVAVALAVTAHILMADVWGISTRIQLFTLIPLSALFVIWFFRYSRAFWLALDLVCDPPKDVDFDRGSKDRRL